MLRTSEDVLKRARIEGRSEYPRCGLIQDIPGFFTERFYPPGSALARVVTRSRDPAVSCLLSFIVEPQTAPGGTSRVRLHARMRDRFEKFHERWLTVGDSYDFTDPNMATPESLHLLQHTRHPIALDFLDDYVYDHGGDVFLDEEGRRVEPLAMLDHAYEDHCATYGPAFTLWYRLGTLRRRATQKAVWRGQDVCLWLTLNLYDIELTAPREGHERDPFHKYRPEEFRRKTEAAGKSHFFGFESSRRALFTNLALVWAATIGLYWLRPFPNFLRTIYINNAMTTAALVFAFLLADVIGPGLLISSVCLLSRISPSVLFLRRKVRTFRRSGRKKAGAR